MIDPEYATAKLAAQFDRSPEFILDESHRDPAAPVTQQQIMVEVTDLVATTFIRPRVGEGVLSPGQEFQQLVVWNKWLRNACSARYADLRDPTQYDTEGLDKQALNRDKELQVLNGIRRGVKRAMKRSQADAERWGAIPSSSVA